MALLTTGFWLELNVRRFCVKSAKGWGGRRRSNQAAPTTITASDPGSQSGQRRPPSPGPPGHPLPEGEGLGVRGVAMAAEETLVRISLALWSRRSRPIEGIDGVAAFWGSALAADELASLARSSRTSRID